MLRRLNEVDGLERFLGRAYVGYKRFSVEGTDALVPMLDAVIDESGRAGAREVVIGMAHRGRLNVLTNVMGKPFETLFAEFEGRHDHVGRERDRRREVPHGLRRARATVDGREVRLRLVPNPSHLEVVNPVIEGVARALQRVPGNRASATSCAVVPVAIHGDAAFPGEGIVAETLNISRLNAYRTGGTIHIIVNNQVGFTTDPIDARSTHYASRSREGLRDPDLPRERATTPQACITAVRLACAYRATFRKDVLIDLVGYRRHGHNEGDEPTYTQPTRYARIKQHPTVPQAWADASRRRGRDDAPTRPRPWRRPSPSATQTIHARFKSSLLASEQHAPWPAEPAGARRCRCTTAVPAAAAAEHQRSAAAVAGRLHGRIRVWRSSSSAVARRWVMQAGIDWGHAEALAFGSLLIEGVSIRMSGQDVERGTFSHRHAVLNDVEDGAQVRAAGASAGQPGRVRDLQLGAVRDGGAGVRIRLQHRGAPIRSRCGKRSSATS